MIPPRFVLAITFVAAMVRASPARGAPRTYGFVYAPDVVSAGTIETQTWFSDEVPQSGSGSWEWWLGPDVGVTNSLEMGLFAVVGQAAPSNGVSSAAVLDALRFYGQFEPGRKGTWPVDLALRAEYGMAVGGLLSSAWVTAIASRDEGPINATANLGVGFWLAPVVSASLVYSLGASYEVLPGIRWGAEVNGQTDIGESTKLFVGPSLGIVQGRFWLAATIGPGFGGKSPNYHGRLVIGLLL